LPRVIVAPLDEEKFGAAKDTGFGRVDKVVNGHGSTRKYTEG
jgi:hypothetical protein